MYWILFWLLLATPAIAGELPPANAPVLDLMVKQLLPRFQECEQNGRFYGIQALDTYEDGDSQIWAFTIVLTVCGQEALVSTGSKDCTLVSQDLKFRAGRHRVPVIISISKPEPWVGP